MPNLELDPELQLQRLEYRYRRALNAFAGARAVQAAVRESPRSTTTQLQQAARSVEEAQRYLLDLQTALEQA
jgi:hypothetical protein